MNSISRRPVLAALAAALCLPAIAQKTYPNRRISIYVPFPAGGPADVAARVLQPPFQKTIGETVIVENFGGGGGSIGVNKLLAAPADGHTLLLATVAEPILPPLTMKGIRYAPAQLHLVSALSYTNIALVARPGLGLDSLEAFMRRVKDGSQPALTYGTPGTGTLFHLMGEHFKQLSGARLLHVPYKGFAPAINDLMGGQVDVAFLPLAGNALQLIESGKVVALAVSAPPKERSDHPRLADLPGLSSFVYTVWTGIFVAAGTPPAVEGRVREAVDAALQGPDFAKYTREVGGVPYQRAMDAGQASAFYASEMKRLEKIFKEVGLEVD